jgi:DNA primase
MISTSAISRVLAATDMLDLANQYSAKPLRKVGKQWACCCFFHKENTPSFYISHSHEYWHCKGACNLGGNAIDFVMRIEHLQFPDAVRLLASRAGIEVENSRPEDATKEAYARALAEEAKWFWKSRGIRVEDEEKAMRDYYRYRAENPGATVEQFRYEQKLNAALAALERMVYGKMLEMAPDLFDETFDDLVGILCRPWADHEPSPVLASEFEPYER